MAAVSLYTDVSVEEAMSAAVTTLTRSSRSLHTKRQWHAINANAQAQTVYEAGQDQTVHAHAPKRPRELRQISDTNPYAVPTLEPTHELFSTASTISTNMGPQSSTCEQYAAEVSVFISFCQIYNYNPWEFTMDLALLFAAYLSERRHHGRILQSADGYFSALNNAYKRKGLGEPWAYEQMTALRAGFRSVQKQIALAVGYLMGSLRIAVPELTIIHMFGRAREAAKIYKFYLQPGLEELKQSKRDAGVNLVWFTTYLLMLLFGFRGDTIGGVDDTGTNCKLFTDLHIYFEVNRVKCRNETEKGLVQPIGCNIPSPRPSSLREEVHNIIALGLSVPASDTDARPLFGPALFGDTPARVSKIISDRMQSDFPAGTPGIPSGSHISSHSWRKAGASALAALRVPDQVIKQWGMWRCRTSIDSYVDDEYRATNFLRQIFDWLVDPDYAQRATVSNWNGWLGYDQTENTDTHQNRAPTDGAEFRAMLDDSMPENSAANASNLHAA